MTPAIFLVAGGFVLFISVAILVLKKPDSSSLPAVLLMLVGMGGVGFGVYQYTLEGAPIGPIPGGTPVAQQLDDPNQAGNNPVESDYPPEYYKAIAKFKDRDRSNDEEARTTILELGEGVIPDLVRIAREDLSPGAREEATETLSKFGEPAIEDIILAFEAEAREASRFGQRHLPQAAGGIGETAVDDLAAVLEREDAAELTKLLAIESLGRTKHEQALEVLLSKMETTESPEMKVALLNAIGRVESAKAKDPLLGLLKEDHAVEVMEAAIEALGYVVEADDRSAIRKIDDFLKDDQWRIRKAAALALGYTKSDRAVRPLLKAMEDDHAQVRAASALALGKIGKKDTMYDIQKIAANEDDNFAKKMMQQAIQQLNKL